MRRRMSRAVKKMPTSAVGGFSADESLVTEFSLSTLIDGGRRWASVIMYTNRRSNVTDPAILKRNDAFMMEYLKGNELFFKMTCCVTIKPHPTNPIQECRCALSHQIESLTFVF